eukprot:3551404-Alexandrium_andersonii.AAC.1
MARKPRSARRPATAIAGRTSQGGKVPKAWAYTGNPGSDWRSGGRRRHRPSNARRMDLNNANAPAAPGSCNGNGNGNRGSRAAAAPLDLAMPSDARQIYEF